jgi:hypothetical protein
LQIGTIIGISMIATGLILAIVIIWKSAQYRALKHKSNQAQDD